MKRDLEILADKVLRDKYLLPEEKTADDMWRRVAKAIASVEKNPEEWQEKFYQILKFWKFIPGGRIMKSAGIETRPERNTLTNCYVIPIEEDSIEGIYDWLKKSALVYRSGGGVGTDISILRPKGSLVGNSGSTPGAVGFMEIMSESTNTISQAGRRGALMISIDCDHPDVLDFAGVKSNRKKIQHANISVKLTNRFLRAVKENKSWELKFDGKVFDTIKAKELWDKIVENAWKFSEPGVLFWDTVKRFHNLEYASKLVGTNP